MGVKFKCESFKACEKGAQNVWRGTNAQKIVIFDDFGRGDYHSNGRYPQSETVTLGYLPLLRQLSPKVVIVTRFHRL